MFSDISLKINVFPCTINISFEETFVIPNGGDQVDEIKYVNTKNVFFFFWKLVQLGITETSTKNFQTKFLNSQQTLEVALSSTQ